MSRSEQLLAKLTSPEVATFLAVGGAGYVVDVTAFNLLRSESFLSTSDPSYARIVAVALAMVVTYLGNRLYTWRDHASGDRRREIGLFVIFNMIGLGLSVATLVISHDLLGLTSPLADNISANVVGLALGTLFRYWSYKRFVFNASAPAVPLSGHHAVRWPVPVDLSAAHVLDDLTSMNQLPAQAARRAKRQAFVIPAVYGELVARGSHLPHQLGLALRMGRQEEAEAGPTPQRSDGTGEPVPHLTSDRST